MGIKLYRHLVMEFGQKKGYRRSFYGHRYRSVTVSTIPDCHTFLHSKKSTTSTAVRTYGIRITRSDAFKWKSGKWLRHAYCFFRMGYLLVGRGRSGVGVRVGVGIFRPESESDSESLKIRRLHCPASYYTISF